MKQEIKINEAWLKDQRITWESEEYGVSFKEWLYEEFANDPTVGTIIGVSGMVFPDNQANTEEYEAMSEEEQKKELTLRLETFYNKAAEILGITREELDTVIK